jgi:hypothetical protein
MYDAINSPEGRAGAVKATKDGEPALAGVEPLIRAALGVDYGPHNWMTVIAGSMVGEMMQSLGYRKVGRKDGCDLEISAAWPLPPVP